MKKEHSNGATASYYEIPAGATQLQDLISDRDMNAQIGEVFRACYRYGRVSHSDKLRDAKKIFFYAQAEVKRLEKLAEETITPADPVAAAVAIKSSAAPSRNCKTCAFYIVSLSIGLIEPCYSCEAEVSNFSKWSPR